jgi:hypothetical protein
VPLTAGLFSTPPRPMQFVYLPSFPYPGQPFFLAYAFNLSVLVVEVVTSYSSDVSAATVRVNGSVIGTIPPNPWSLAAPFRRPVSIHFDNAVLRPRQTSGLSLNNQWEIVPAPGTWLMVGNWRIHYWQNLP